MTGPATALFAAIDQVVRNGNCSGCGGCATLSPAVGMELDGLGYARPVPAAGQNLVPEQAVADFARICPGVAVTAPAAGGRATHPVLGSYVSIWSASAVDEELRFAGSSGGVLSALADFLLSSGESTSVLGARGSLSEPTRTAVSVMRSRDEVLASAGSRYAPVAVAASFDRTDGQAAMVGKPCETYAARRLVDIDPGRSARPSPILLSFFCAGVPSQNATDSLVSELGVPPAAVSDLRYRGNGWPGEFAVVAADGTRSALSYEESWGSHLGKTIQPRCRICPDGTGGHADIAVGDYWASDAAGYPVFLDGPGVSVAIARTQRGHDLLQAASRAGVLRLEPVDAAAVAAVQPFQVLRRRTLPGRLLGRRLAGRAVPRFRGYRLALMAVRFPQQNVDFTRGSRARARAERSAEVPAPQ